MRICSGQDRQSGRAIIEKLAQAARQACGEVRQVRRSGPGKTGRAIIG